MIVSVDTECTGLDIYHGARPFFVTMSCDEAIFDGHCQGWWSWLVDPTTRVPQIHEEDVEEIERVLTEAEELVLQNSKFDVIALKSIGVLRNGWPWDKEWERLAAAHLLARHHLRNLTALAVTYLGEDIGKYEDRVKEAGVEARRLAKSRRPEWRLAREGDPTMPSARGGEGRQDRGEEKRSPWKFDMWLPKQLA